MTYCKLYMYTLHTHNNVIIYTLSLSGSRVFPQSTLIHFFLLGGLEHLHNQGVVIPPVVNLQSFAFVSLIQTGRVNLLWKIDPHRFTEISRADGQVDANSRVLAVEIFHVPTCFFVGQTVGRCHSYDS